MTRLKVLLTVTDGVDNTDDGDSFRPMLISYIRSRGILSLSCGIGEVGVEHDGLLYVAQQVGGLHMLARDSSSIARAISQITTVIETRVQSVSVVQDQWLVQQLGMAVSAVGRIPVDVMALIDRSWSMLGMVQYEGEKDDWSGDSQKLPNTKMALARLMSVLNPATDRVAVASFCERYSLVRGLTADLGGCVRAINSIDGGCGTALYRSMLLGAQDLVG